MIDFFREQIKKRGRIIRYIISGGTATGVNLFLLYAFTDWLGFWYLISAVLAFIGGFFTSFFLQKLWTFKDKGQEQIRRQMTIFLLLALINLFGNTFLMYVLVDIFKVWYMLAQFVIAGVIALWNYNALRLFVFRPAKVIGEGTKKDQLKVLIATGIYPPDVGGPATLLTALPAALAERGLAVKVITYSDVAVSDEEQRAGSVYRIERRQNPFLRQLKYLWQLWRLSQWGDLIYATDTYSVGFFAYLVKKLTDKKYLIRFAGDSAWETAVACGWTDDYILDFQNKKYGRRVEKLKRRQAQILIGADKVIAVSHFMAGLAKTIGVAQEKIRMIHNAVDFFGDYPQRIKPVSPTLVFAGRLMPWKGVGLLLRVVAKLKLRWPDIIFEVLGDGPEEGRLKELAGNLGLEQNVKFRGRLSETETHKIFARSSVFVLNTNYEGLPHSVLNAMACALPVITTPVGGNQEVIENGVNGLLAPYNDETAWLAAISRLLADESLRQQLAMNGQKTLEKFKWVNLVAQNEEVLKEIRNQ